MIILVDGMGGYCVGNIVSEMVVIDLGVVWVDI